MTEALLTPKDAADEMEISVATITRCVKRGAPVHRWGSTGYRYRINVHEFTKWMERQGPNVAPCVHNMNDVNGYTTNEMAEKRRAAMRVL